jgi:hypothetical protein
VALLGDYLDFWDLEKKGIVRTGRRAGLQRIPAAFSATGDLVAFPSPEKSDAEFEIYDLKAGKPVGRLFAFPKNKVLHTAPLITGLCFSHDARAVYVGGHPGLVAFAMGTGRIVLQSNDAAGVQALTISADGRLLATGGSGGKVALWEAATGRLAAAFSGKEGPRGIYTVAFSADGHRLASGASDTTVLVWDVTKLGLLGLKDNDKPPEPGVLWKHLGQDDAQLAFQSACLLVTRPDAALTLLEASLKPEPPARSKKVRELVGALDSPKESDRAKADKALSELGADIEPILREILTEEMAP